MLVNRGTYGAAELAADAIEDAKRGDVVGERTFGEGSVQKTIELPDGAALLLTVAKYEGPDGKKIQDEAVTPTVLVGQNADDDVDADESAANKERRAAQQGARICSRPKTAELQKQAASRAARRLAAPLSVFCSNIRLLHRPLPALITRGTKVSPAWFAEPPHTPDNQSSSMLALS